VSEPPPPNLLVLLTFPETSGVPPAIPPNGVSWAARRRLLGARKVRGHAWAFGVIFKLVPYEDVYPAHFLVSDGKTEKKKRRSEKKYSWEVL